MAEAAATAIVAVTHSVLVSICHMLRDHQPYHEPAPDHFDRPDAPRIRRQYVRRLQQLGYAGALTPAGAAWPIVRGCSGGFAIGPMRTIRPE